MSKKNSLVTDLQNLTPEELAAVERLIGKFTNRHSEKPRPKKGGNRHRKPKEEVEDFEEEEIEEEEKETRYTKATNRGRKNPRNSNANPVRRTMSGKGRQARVEPINITGENKFMKMPERNAAKKDTIIDRKLWGENEPTPRPEEYRTVEVQCQVCNRWFDVNPAFVFSDPETGDTAFTCDNCHRR